MPSLRYRNKNTKLYVQANTLRVENFSHLSTRELPHSVDYILNFPERIKALVSPSAQVRLSRGYREQIHMHLGAALKWLCDKKLHPKLEGRWVGETVCMYMEYRELFCRFGKLQWTDLPISFQKQPVSIKDFVEFISSHKHRRSFSTR